MDNLGSVALGWTVEWETELSPLLLLSKSKPTSRSSSKGSALRLKPLQSFWEEAEGSVEGWKTTELEANMEGDIEEASKEDRERLMTSFLYSRETV